MDKIDVQFWKRLRLTMALAFSSSGPVNITGCIGAFVLLTGLMEQILTYFVGLIASGYYRILIANDWSEFERYTLQSFCLVLVMTLVKGTKQFMAYQANISMRFNLTKKLHEKYTSHNSFCYLNVVDGPCDNPDQRITRDVDSYCTSFSKMVPLILISPFTIGYYTYQTAITAGWTAPCIILVFFIVATVINRFFIVAAGRKVFLKQREEGNFRHKHAVLRSNAESCAYFGYPGSQFEKESLDMSLQFLVKAMYRLSVRQLLLDLATFFWEYSGSILTYVIVAIPLQQNVYSDLPESEIGALISKNAFVCMYLIFCFTSLLGLNDELSQFVGVIHRIGQLIEFMNPNSRHCDKLIAAHDDEQALPLLPPVQQFDAIEFVRKCSPVPDGTLLLQLRGLSVVTPPPDTKLLSAVLSLDVRKGANLLITGPSGCGKTSLFRSLAGIWPIGGGEFEFFGQSADDMRNTLQCIFLPQMPYLTVGTIADNLLFPCSRTSLTAAEESRMQQALMVTGLQDRALAINRQSLAQNTGGSPIMLSDVMSPGEIQRFMFARLLFHSPIIAFLDEPTSSLDESFERRMFEICAAADITLVTIAHRPERLTSFHSHLLRLSSDNPNGWTYTSIL